MMNLKSIIEAEAAIAASLEQFKTDLVAKIAAQGAMEGVTIPENTGVKIAYVKLSTLKENNYSFSPTTFIPKAQADAVGQAIAGCKTVTQTVTKVREMVEKKRVRLSSNHTEMLNRKTLEILSEAIAGIGGEVA